ncbi:Bacitracin synthase [Paenibacillus nuruki]|uniref:Bacitracin synthase n=1 Tax=Paenibacillus nuruki TaxID=1886670 RepID=A0A1E3L8U8_9BACL|nr:non-ribosomal peptide synthetase [Paenibacillus nuruki]ODP30123.1 Bacitracin synthase [Paenibacillus nuruki]
MNSSNRKDKVSTARQALLHKLLQQKQFNQLSNSIIQPVERTEKCPASSAQKRMWFLNQLYPQHAFYNVPFLFHIIGELHINALKQSVQQIVERHEALRTTFVAQDGEVFQTINEHPVYDWKIINISHLDDSLKSITAHRLFQEEAETAFNLSEGPLLRVQLIDLGEHEYFFVLNIHHIVFDGWSMGILCKELEQLYKANKNDTICSLVPLPIQYVDYAHWQNEYIKSEEMLQQLDYWKQKLNGNLPSLQLPYDFPVPSRPAFNGAFLSFSIPDNITQAFKKLGRTYGTTPFMSFLAVYNILLYRYTGQMELVVGTPAANRNNEEVEQLIGFFVNTLAISTSLSSDMSFIEVLKEVQRETLDAYANQDIPFDMVVETVQPERKAGETPLFQILFNLIDDANLQFEGLTVHSLETDNKTSKFDMELTLIDHGEIMSGGVEYNTDLFKEETIMRMIGHYIHLLESVIKYPEQSIIQLEYLSQKEIKQLQGWNKTETVYPDDLCMHHYFENQVKRTPDAIAVIFNEKELSYRELDMLSNGLAVRLQKDGVGPDVCVGICMERSLEMIIAVIGVLKAGGAYVPLDPSYPEERLRYILDDTAISVVLTQSSLSSLLKEANITRIILDDWRELKGIDKAPISGVTPDHILYILYTSGSTGKPKGIVMDHRPIVNLLAWQMKNVTHTGPTTVLQFSTLNFDMSFHEFFSAFCSGGKLILIDEKIRKDPEQLLQVIINNRVERLHLPYISLQQVAEAAEHVEHAKYAIKDITVSGEQLRITPQIKKWHKKLGQCVLQNHYGPTETHVVTAQMIKNMDGIHSLPPIGHAIDNCEIYILDTQLQPVPIGVCGELYIGGVCLARGYLNREKLTAERFISNPFSTKPNQRMYKSGDLARILSDGSVEFLGRIDDQIKIRGFRVEPGEVESVISTMNSIKETVVVGYSGDQNVILDLVAYIVADQKIDELELRKYLKTQLPDYMIPTIFMQIDQMPLTPSGKISRSALPEPIRNMGIAEKKDPVTSTEKVIATIWATILGHQNIGQNDHFFELGGHSLLAIKVISRIRQVFSFEVPLHSVFEYPKLGDFATYVDEYCGKNKSVEEPIIPATRHPYMPLSYAQERIWFFEQWHQSTAVYNISKAIHIQGELDIQALQLSYQQLIERHEILRTNFVNPDGVPLQFIHPTRIGEIQLTDIQHDKKEVESQSLHTFLQIEEQKPFNLAIDLLIRIHVYRLNNTESVLMIVVHHIIFDGWSMSLLEQELWRSYEAHQKGLLIQQEKNKLHYADYAQWQRKMLQGESQQEQLTYWKKQLQGELPILQLPSDYPRPTQQSFKGAQFNFKIKSDLAIQIKQFSAKEDVSLYMTMLTVFKAVLYRYTGLEDVLVGSPMSNRNRTEWEHVIGFFVNTLVIRTGIYSDTTWNELLQNVKKTVLEAFENPDVPFEKLVQELNLERSQDFSPLFQVMFSLQSDQFDYSDMSLSCCPYELDTINSLFDLSMFIEEQEELYITIEYATDLFTSETIQQFAKHYVNLLNQMLFQPYSHVSRTSILDKKETEQMLITWNETKRIHTNTELDVQGIYHRFSNTVNLYYDAIAIRDDKRAITYEQLHLQVQDIAQLLQSMDTNKQTIIGIYMTRSIELISSMLAVLKIEACFVPMDPEYPAERIQWMIENSQMSVILTTSTLVSMLPVKHKCVVTVDQLNQSNVQSIDQNEIMKISATEQNDIENAAYMIYTSGSTGHPKGVIIPQTALMDHTLTVMESNSLNNHDQVVQFSAISFDFSIHEIFPTLLAGATLVLRPQSVVDTHEFVKWINRKQISVLYLPTAYWHLLVSEWNDTDQVPSSLKLVSVGGEKASVSLYEKWKNITGNHVRWNNAYGPTEATVAATSFYDDQDEWIPRRGDIPIGRALPYTQLYILDPLFQLVPIGVTGELFIGGKRLASGYWGQPELSKQSFIVNPFYPEERLYRTGDYARYLPDGQIEYIGRKDAQIKIRGYRVELGEIENQLEKIESIEKSIVIVSQHSTHNNKQLVAYLKCNTINVSLDEIRHSIKQQLPAYMQPTFYLKVEQFPMTAGGKVDYQRLAQMDNILPVDEQIELPSTFIEKKLALIWCRFLQRAQVGVNENFFDIGGHSLLATQIVSAIQTEFSKQIPVKTIFDSPTIIEMARILDKLEEKENIISIPKISRLPRASKR